MKKKVTLRDMVEADIHAFLNPEPTGQQPLTSGAKGWNRLFYNETEFQRGLSNYLEDTGKYDAIYVEYKVPNKMPFRSEKAHFMFIDIVVKGKDGDYVPIELKFKPNKEYKTGDLRFGKADDYIEFQDDPYTRNLNRKDYWKDVERLEWLRDTYPNVVGGIFVLVTNDDDYEHKPGTHKDYGEIFSIMAAHDAQPVFNTDEVHVNISRPHDVNWYPAEPNTYCMGKSQIKFVHGTTQNRVALGVVKEYVALCDGKVTLEELREAFPNKLNPDSGVKENFVELSTATSSGWKGYFTEGNDIIKTIDGKDVCVVNMWTRPSLNRLAAHAWHYGIIAVAPEKGTGGVKGSTETTEFSQLGFRYCAIID